MVGRGPGGGMFGNDPFFNDPMANPFAQMESMMASVFGPGFPAFGPGFPHPHGPLLQQAPPTYAQRQARHGRRWQYLPA